jgi:hypothetical protein
VHDPGKAREAHDERSTRDVPQLRPQQQGFWVRSSSPPPGILWADWIAAGLQGRAVRALYVVADGAFDADVPLLAVSPDPNVAVGRDSCAYVPQEDVRLLADAVGAAVLSFGSPPGNPSDVATRVIADALGLQRAGTTLYSSLPLDPAGYALARAHEFMAAETSGTVPIPRHPSLFAYLQPESVEGSLRESWPSAEPTDISFGGPAEEAMLPVPEARPDVPPPSDALRAYYADADEVPAWLAASERYIDANLARLSTPPAAAGEATSTRQAYEDGTAEALTELRALVTKHAGPQ